MLQEGPVPVTLIQESGYTTVHCRLAIQKTLGTARARRSLFLFGLALRDCLMLIRTMPASRPATVTALQVIRRGEDHVRSFKVVVLGRERGRRRGRIAVHLSILS